MAKTNAVDAAKSAELNLYEKLALIRDMTSVLIKNRSGFNYKYTSIDEILAKVTAGMKKYGVSLIPKIDHESIGVSPSSYVKTKFTKDGVKYDEAINEMVVSGNITYRWIDDRTGESIDVPWFMAGSAADPSQAFGGGMTYCLRQFLTHYFQISLLDGTDPDEWRSKQREAENVQEAEIASAIIEKVDEIAKANTNEKNQAGLSEVVKSIVKINGKSSANYRKVTDPAMASELLDAVTKYFNKEEK